MTFTLEPAPVLRCADLFCFSKKTGASDKDKNNFLQNNFKIENRACRSYPHIFFSFTQFTCSDAILIKTHRSFMRAGRIYQNKFFILWQKRKRRRRQKSAASEFFPTRKTKQPRRIVGVVFCVHSKTRKATPCGFLSPRRLTSPNFPVYFTY